MSDREVARDIRRDVEAGGGSRWVPVRTLRDAFGRTTLTRKARAEIAAALAEVGVQAEPDLETVALKDNVRLYLADEARIRDGEEALPPVGAGWFPDPEDSRLVRYWDGTAWTEHRRRAVAPAPVPAWTPSPAPPNAWQRFRAWPAWAQLAAGAAALILVVAVAAGNDSGDGGDSEPDPPPAQQAGGPDSADDDEAEERERARERKRERAKRKRERARERERRRERRRREEARERREREAPPPPEEEPEPASDCDPNYSGCVPPYPPDVNCPEVDGPVTVIGDDPHGLDRDGDKQACEN